MKKWMFILGICVLVFSSCVIEGITEIESVSGKAIDVTNTGYNYWAGLSGATVKLTNVDTGNTYYTSVGSGGSFEFRNISSGYYKLEGSKAGSHFVPRYMALTVYDTTVPDLIAYPSSNPSDIYVIVNWTNTYYDVDAYMVRDMDNDTDRTDGTKVAGPGITDLADKIFYLYNAYPSLGSGRPMVETIRVGGFNGGSNEELRYYLHLNSGNPSESLTGGSGSSAGAMVYVVQGGAIWGTFPVAFGTDEKVLSVVTFIQNGSGNTWSIGSSGGGWINGGAGTGQIKSVQDQGYVIVEQK